MSKIAKIVILTTGQPSTNPRAVKEAVALQHAGYTVTFIYSFWTEWASEYDKEIIKSYPGIKWQLAGVDPGLNKVRFAISRAKHKAFRLLNRFYPGSIFISKKATSRNYDALLQAAGKNKADLYIAHNLGALPAAAAAAKRNRSEYGFDAEDFHRGQEVAGSHEFNRITRLEDHYIRNASYLTAASPLIANEYKRIYNKEVTVVNNAFTLNALNKSIQPAALPLKLFWFSQTIGKGRGVEDIILALKEMPVSAFSLTLLGKHDEEIKNYFIQLGRSKKQQVDINLLQPVSTDEIFKIAAQHDIGLALETGKDQNNSIALSNKIFTYLLAGNAIIFSDTEAQKDFYLANPEIGKLYQTGNVAQLKTILRSLCENLAAVDEMKRTALKLAVEKYNWEEESKKFLAVIEGLEVKPGLH